MTPAVVLSEEDAEQILRLSANIRSIKRERAKRARPTRFRVYGPHRRLEMAK